MARTLLALMLPRQRQQAGAVNSYYSLLNLASRGQISIQTTERTRMRAVESIPASSRRIVLPKLN